MKSRVESRGSRVFGRGLLVALFAAGCPSEKKTDAPPPPPAAPPVEQPPPPPPVEQPPPPSGGGAGTIKGIVSFKGTPPKAEKVDMKKDPKCIEINKTQEIPTVVTADGKLADVLVRIAEGLPEQKWETRTDAITMDQKGCVYTPRMIAVQVDQTFTVLNSDPLLHNVHAFAKRGEFNQAMPKQGSKIDKKFKAQDLEGKITCEVHPWMQASLRVMAHPFFDVTGDDGSFTIENVPAGKYKLEMEHVLLGKKTIDVEVSAGGSAEANGEFAGN